MTQKSFNTVQKGLGMPKQIKAALLAGTLLIASAAVAETEENTAQNTIAQHRWEIGISAAGFVEGNTGDNLKSSGGGGIRVGYRWDPSWCIVGDYLYTNDVGINDKTDESDIHRILASVNWDAWPDDSYTPYLLVGGGYETMPDFDDRDGALVFLGGGVRYIFAESWGLNAEGKLKWNLDHTDQNAIITLSLNYRFGEAAEEE